jgi:hypothetical protein
MNLNNLHKYFYFCNQITQYAEVHNFNKVNRGDQQRDTE